jgi:S1-C subfamily serine protease
MTRRGRARLSPGGIGRWVGLICVASFPACTLLMPPSPVDIASETREPALAEAAGVAPPVWGSATRLKSGTGFFVSHEGLVLTSAHIVLGCGQISVWSHRGAMAEARIRAIDPGRDIALLESGMRAPEIATAPGPAPPRRGEPVFSLGFAINTQHPLVPAAIHGDFSGAEANVGGSNVWMIRAPVRPGMSGGLVVDSTGALLGMVIGYDTDRPSMGLILPASVIGEFLARRGLRLTTARSASRGRQAVGRHLLNVSVLVQCDRLRSTTRPIPRSRHAPRACAAAKEPPDKEPQSDRRERGDACSVGQKVDG